jgi:hypothetical protein
MDTDFAPVASKENCINWPIKGVDAPGANIPSMIFPVDG